MTQAHMVMHRGEACLVDPEAVAVIQAVERHNCRGLFDLNADRVKHFERRVTERGDDPRDMVIVLLNVDDTGGAALADVLMPGHDWQAYRDRGELPVARGLAGRPGITEALEMIDPYSASKLRGLEGLAVVVVDRGVAAVFCNGDRVP